MALPIKQAPDGGLIKAQREAAKLTQQQAAEMVYLGSFKRWSEYERDVVPMDSARWELFLIKTGDHPLYKPVAPVDVQLVDVRISATIENEYANRLPDFLPLDKLSAGVVRLTVEEAGAVLADAEFNSDPKAYDVGDHGMPLGTFNAYRALAKQLRSTLAKLGGRK